MARALDQSYSILLMKDLQLCEIGVARFAKKAHEPITVCNTDPFPEVMRGVDSKSHLNSPVSP